MGFTTQYANSILTTLFNGASVGLSTTTPSVDGKSYSEPSGNGYKKVPLDGSSGNITVSDRKATNKAYIYFPEATASWGTITHLLVFNGSLSYFGKLNSAVAVEANTVPLFRPETLNISLSD
jgi:hypothetical protein